MSKKQPYHWQGINKNGQAVSGVVQESSLLAVKYQLQRQGIQPTRVQRKRPPLFSQFKQTITAADIAIMTRQLATMLHAGIPLVQSLKLIARSATKAPLAHMLTLLVTDVENGQPLSRALKQFPMQFSNLYQDLVQSGEQMGALAEVFEQLADYAEKAQLLKAKIKKALFYPAIVLLVAALVSAILLLWVIPQFEEMYANFGAPLPWFTQVVISLSRGLQHYGGYLLLVLVLLCYWFIKARRSANRLRQQQDRLLLKLPVLGAILQKAALTGFARTLAATFAAGIPLIEGLTLAAGACGNHVYSQAVLQVRADVVAGIPLHLALGSSQLFPDLLVQLAMIGEETGVIDDMMHKVASIYEAEVDAAVEALASLIEPMMMLVLGILVGGLVIAMYLPIFNLGSVIH
ncbi:type II secretion system F family protein [Oceanisphaera sp. IT1-181]|uniref:type II secretion system F family protein n=1 Tax=Oceanisphaera sp. IT1-181 TaxID=3081199 RepID=UPI0029C9B943|nr:type II secretion system F family protein [Oceanisphaera sp. IT1-181]